MASISDIFAPLAISQLILLGTFLVTHYRGLLARLLAFFCLCLTAYVLLTMRLFDSNIVILYTLGRLATASPYAIWLIALLLFVDGGRIKPWVWATILFFFLVRALGQLAFNINPDLGENLSYLLVANLLPQLGMFGFSLHTIMLAFQGYQDDLVVGRRQFRVLFVLCMGAVVVAVLGIGVVNQMQTLLEMELIGGLNDFPSEVFSAYIFFVSLLLNVRAFRLSSEAINLIPDNVVKPIYNGNGARAQNSSDLALVHKLESAMHEEKLFREAGLTISQLAEHLSIQEYKLRRLINHSMNYRNFNQFLNNYRIQDASEQLINSGAPISSIALGVGYSSLSVFNKAFKERFNMTPTEFRNSYHGDEIFREAGNDGVAAKKSELASN